MLATLRPAWSRPGLCAEIRPGSLFVPSGPTVPRTYRIQEIRAPGNPGQTKLQSTRMDYRPICQIGAECESEPTSPNPDRNFA